MFERVDLMPFSPPIAAPGMQAAYTPAPIPAGTSGRCGICGAPRSDRVHVDGEAAADAESPHWG